MRNFLDCACVAAITALAHFKRPDVTASGDGEFIIHTPAQKDLVPLVLHHFPICVTYALFEEGKVPVADPTALEERISNASMVFAINSYKELCSLHLTGVTLTSPRLIQQCSELAAKRSRRIVDYIKHTLEENNAQRNAGELKGLSEVVKLSKVTANSHEATKIERMEASESESEKESLASELEEKPVNVIDKNTVASDKWNVNEESSGSDEEMPVAKNAKKKEPKMEIIEGSSDEEKETIVLH
jgi:exosome complex component RRP45